MHLVQYSTTDGARRVGVVEAGGATISPLVGYATTYELATAAVAKGITLAALCATLGRDATVDYDELLLAGRILAPLDHPEPARFLITGTGLTHLGSADARDKMHALEHGEEAEMSDSMKIFQMGIEAGKPAKGEVGVQPEWFFKGVGTCIVPPEAPLELPAYALAGGEEAEIVGLYLIGPDGTPWRIGFAIGNEFSDQVTEALNYLYTAHSKLRQCSIGPAILVGDLPEHVEGAVRITRGEQTVWEGKFLSGERNMSHSIGNLEHYHFRYDTFRRPGDLHAYFMGAALLSCAHGVTAQVGDRFEIDVPVFGRPLRNTMEARPAPRFEVKSL